MNDGGRLVLVLVGVVACVLGLLGSRRSYPVDLVHAAGPEPAAASSVAHRICLFEVVDTAVAAGEAVAGAVASTYRALLGA
jgi:hypothetical protein